MEKAMRIGSILISSSFVSIAVVILMLLLILILILIACKFKPWRRFLAVRAAARRRSPPSIKEDDIERPLIYGDLGFVESQNNESTLSSSIGQSGHHVQGGLGSTCSTAVAPKDMLPSAPLKLAHSDSFILDISNTMEDSLVGQTLKRPLPASQFPDEWGPDEKEDINHTPEYGADKDAYRDFILNDTAIRGSILMLEVISGPSCGLWYSIQSTDKSRLPVTIGRVSPCDVILKDSEVSGKHASINWNINKLKWELVDIGSLNGTTLNSKRTKTVHLSQSGSRNWSNPIDLSSGDVISLGTSSKILVNITVGTESKIPFGVGMASDPMALRRGARKLPMEDVCYYQWPLPGMDKFGLFGICDGHGGAGAATSVSKIMPEVIAGILSDPFRKEKVLSQCDASDVLREAFYHTEASIDHYYEGCTATVVLIWADGLENFYVQCANVGDSTCIVNIDGKQSKMTEDHRITSYSERLRIQSLGQPLRDGETRICGLNLARMLGDKFLKEQDVRFSSEPYISEVTCINRSCQGFVLIASDGFWDVINMKKAALLVHQAMDNNRDKENSAEKMANILLNEARTLRTKDNTSIIFLDFTSSRVGSRELE